MEPKPSGTVQAVAQRPGFDGFCSQHALEREIVSFLKSRGEPAYSGTHLGTFVRATTGEFAKVSLRAVAASSMCVQASIEVIDANLMLSCLTRDGWDHFWKRDRTSSA